MKPLNNKTGDPIKITNEREFKKSINLKTRGTLFFQIGLVISLLVVIFLMQVKVGYGKVEEKVITEDPWLDIPQMDFTVEKPVIKVQEIAKVTPVLKQPPVRIFTQEFKVVDNNTPEVADTDIVTTIEPIVDSTPTPTPIQTKPTTLVVDLNVNRNINQVEFVPVFPGCESFGTNEEKKACMSTMIADFISKKFRTENFTDLNKKDVHKIYVQFKIDTAGNVTEVVARAPQKAMQDEGVRVIEKLPKMTPGRMGDVNVPVTYLVPISFRVQ